MPEQSPLSSDEMDKQLLEAHKDSPRAPARTLCRAVTCGFGGLGSVWRV
jgi:hypothetical protein